MQYRGVRCREPSHLHEPSMSTTTPAFKTEPVPTSPPVHGWRSLAQLSGYQWFVFIVCCLAWDMDCMDQQLFVLARRPAMGDLVKVTEKDPRIEARAQALQGNTETKPTTEQVILALRNDDIQVAGSWATSIFMIGWAIGGICFGIMGDRVGRVKTLMLTILLYAIFTGLSAISASTTDFFIYRFLTGLGVGGVFAAAVTLLAETMPDNARPFALGLFQATSVAGNVTAALVSMWLGSLHAQGAFKGYSLLGHEVTAWRLMFVLGIIPGLLVVVIQFWLREPEKWKQMVAAGGRRGGSYAELLGDRKWAPRAIFGLLLALSGVIGLWGIGFFSPDLIAYVSEGAYKQEAIQRGVPDVAAYVAGQKAYWSGVVSLVQNIGAFFGVFAFSYATLYIGRKPTFAFFFVAAGLSTAAVFLFLRSWVDILWMPPMMGFFQLALFGGYAIYFPELFPTRLRSTGTSFCYNVGRLISASGPAILGLLTSQVFAAFPAPYPLRYAGVAMCSIFLLGLLVLPFLPETRGQPLPE
jgi:Sugar (and other) transporter